MIRPPVAADKYYSAAPRVLAQQLAACFAEPAPPLHLPGGYVHPNSRAHQAARLQGLIVPHGALQDSGFVAATAYKLLEAQLSGQGQPQQPVRAIILGTNHFILQPAACLSSARAWRTPIGDVPIDQELNRELKAGGIPYDDGPHSLEHSIENQLPFLQHITTRLGDASIAPISIGWLSGEAEVQQLAGVLAALINSHPPGSVVLIATSDFTHAGPAYNEATAAPWMSLREHCIWRDSPLLHAVVQGDPKTFLDAVATAGTSLCGRWPVAVFIGVAQALGWDLKLLTYAPSDLYVMSSSINGFASFAAYGTAS